MKQFLLSILPEVDCDFLNACEIPFKFLDRLSSTDSGWCDASTGCVILRENELILFTVNTDEEELLLNLRFGSRIAELETNT